MNNSDIDWVGYFSSRREDLSHCDRCRETHCIDDLDAKPDRFDRFWWFFLPVFIARRLLGNAAERGEEFDTLLCKRCYGPGYERLYDA